MIGNQGDRNPRGGFSLREVWLVLALVSGVAAAGFFIWQNRCQASRAAGAGSDDPSDAPLFSSRVLNELAKENKKFAAWMKAVASGVMTNEDWTILWPGEDDLLATNSPEFIARSKQMADPTSASGRLARTAGGSDPLELAAVQGAGATNKSASKAEKKKSRLSKMTSEELREKTEAGIAEKLKQIEQMAWSPQAAQMLNQVLGQWARIDPQAALNYALSLESRRARVNAVNSILGTWARTDPVAAQSWFMQNMPQDPLAAAATVRQLYSGIGAENLNSALGAIWQLPTPELQKIAMQTIMGQVVASGDEATVSSFYATMTDPIQKNYLAMSMAQTWAAYQPDVAAQWLSKVTDPVMQKQGVSQLASAWAFEDPIAATMWAAQLPTSTLRSPTLVQTTKTWAKEDPVAAADWVLTMNPPTPQADPAIQGLVGAILYVNPQSAMMWANAVNDPNLRTSMMKQAGQVWMAQDPANASLYIQQSSLPQSTKNQLLGQTMKTPTTKPKTSK